MYYNYRKCRLLSSAVVGIRHYEFAASSLVLVVQSVNCSRRSDRSCPK